MSIVNNQLSSSETFFHIWKEIENDETKFQQHILYSLQCSYELVNNLFREPETIEQFWEHVFIREMSEKHLQMYIQFLANCGMIFVNVDTISYTNRSPLNIFHFDLVIRNKRNNVQTLKMYSDEFNLFPDNMIDWFYFNYTVLFPFTLKTNKKIFQFPIVFNKNSILT